MTTADVVFHRQLEVIGSIFLVFERAVFLNTGKKINVWCFSGKKVGKKGGLMKSLTELWSFYFATHVQFLVGSLTKQVANMERVSHRILSLLIHAGFLFKILYLVKCL